MRLLGNLDCEARWAGVALPAAVQRRISLYATLLAACAPDDDRPEIWVPAEVDAARLIAHPRWAPPVVRWPVPSDPLPGAFDLAWADPAAAAANDRSRALAIAGELGVALPGARVVASLAELDAHLAAHFAGPPGRPWICKARWTAAGRDRARGTGDARIGELRTRISRMLQRFGPLVLEPWLDRLLDLGVCGEVTADGEVRLLEPHRIATDPRGGFLGIELSPRLDPGIAEQLRAVAHAAANRLAAQTGYRGRFAIDAFVYCDPRRDPRHDPRSTPESAAHLLHPLCEINARHSFGWIAHALARRLGARRLGFDAPPPGATVLIAPGPDRVTAWCA